MNYKVIVIIVVLCPVAFFWLGFSMGIKKAAKNSQQEYITVKVVNGDYRNLTVMQSHNDTTYWLEKGIFIDDVKIKDVATGSIDTVSAINFLLK